MSTISGLLLRQPEFAPFELGRTLSQANQIAGGHINNQTALLALEDLRRQQAEQARERQFMQENAGAMLGGGGALLASPVLTAGGGPMTQQTMVPGQEPGAPQVVPGGQDLSRFATTGAPGGPQPALAQLQAPRDDFQARLQGLMATDPGAALRVMQTQLKLQTQRLEIGEKIAGSIGRIAQGVTDQASLDQARQEIAQIDPRAAAQLPQFYSKDAMTPFIERALDVKSAQTLKIQAMNAHSAAVQAQAEIGRYNLQLQHAGYQGLSDGVTGILKGLTPEQVQEFGGRTSDKAINYATRQWEENKLRVSREQGAAQAGEQPLDDPTRQRVTAYRRGEQLANQLLTEFTPEERAKFVGMGGMRMTGKQLEAWLADATKRQADPRFARFLTLLNEAKTEAFATGGKALTKQEADVVFGYIPTGAETSVAQFEQKLGQARTRSSERLDEEIKLATTPKRALAGERAGGSLTRPGGGSQPTGKGGTVTLETLSQYADKHKIPLGQVIKQAYDKGLEIQ